MECCSLCRYFEPAGVETDGDGLCRLEPPQMGIDAIDPLRGCWPVVAADDWCGEFDKGAK